MKNLAYAFSRFFIASLMVLIFDACRNPTGPTEDPCPATTATLTVIYKQEVAKVRPGTIAIPSIAENDFNGGPTHITDMTKTGDFTWTATITVPTNVNQQAHQIHIVDAGLLGEIITATDIFLNGKQVVKGKSPSGNFEYGFFHVDGCGNIS